MKNARARTHLPLPAKHVGTVSVKHDAVAETSVIGQLHERVIDSFRRRDSLPNTNDTLRDFNFRWAESIIIFAQWKQAAEC